MTLRRGVLLAMLVYVTLDLSLPAMPGAFVFEPADSVEGAQTSRGRTATDVVLLPAPVPSALAPATPRIEAIGRSRAAVGVRSAGPDVVSRRPRAALASPPASEDPQ